MRHLAVFNIKVRQVLSLVPIGVFVITASLSHVVSAESLSFANAWKQLLTVSDKLKAQSQEVSRAEAEERAGEDMNLPSLNLAGSYTRLEKPIELDLRDLNPIAAIDPGALPPALGEALAAIPGSLFVTPFTEQDIFRASLQAMWPIYTGGKITAAQGIHAAHVEEKKHQYSLTSRDMFNQLVDRYFAVAVKETLVGTKQQIVDSFKEHESHPQKQENEGQNSKNVSLNSQMAPENTKKKPLNAKRQH